jgi:hypothetical protein
VKSASVAAGTVIAAMIAVAGIALAHYAGSAWVFVVFNVCFFGLFALIFPRPRLYVYTFLAGFLGLGFWLKALMHAIWAPGFVEPVGDFAGTPQEWDSALLAASCGVLGIIAARCVHLWHAGKRRGTGEYTAGAAPDWFVRWRQPIWLFTVVVIVAVNVANQHFAFFQIGVNPKLTLPMRLHVVLGWLVNIGFALWIAALLWWDHCNGQRTLPKNLVMAMVEALFSTASALSRLIYLLHAGPYWLALVERRKEFAAAINRRQLVRLIGYFLFLFALSIVIVFYLRVLLYYGYLSSVPPSEPLSRHVHRTMEAEMPVLFIHRWVGLEGVLVVGAAENRGSELLVAAVTESPKRASQALFQRAAKVKYFSEDPHNFTFLANAGPIAILLFSGSLPVVFIGMMLIGLVVILTEEMTRWWTGNPFLLAVSGAALANVASQTTFPYLTLIFLMQMWVAVGFVALIQRWRIAEPVARPFSGGR